VEPASPTTLLQLLQGRAVVFSGDSLTRGLFQSLVCFLWSANMERPVEIITTEDYKSYSRFTLDSPLSLGGRDLFTCALLGKGPPTEVEAAICYVLSSRADNLGVSDAAVVYNGLLEFADLFVLDPFGHFQTTWVHGKNVLHSLNSSNAFADNVTGPWTLIWDRHASHFSTDNGLYTKKLHSLNKCGASTVGSNLDRARISLSLLPAANRLMVYEASRERPDDHVRTDCNHACTCLHGGVHEWAFTQIEHKIKWGEIKLPRHHISLAARLEALEHCRTRPKPCVDHPDGHCPRHKRNGGCDNKAFRVRCPQACQACFNATGINGPSLAGARANAFTMDCVPGRAKRK
jgi:hypothetical protein